MYPAAHRVCERLALGAADATEAAMKKRTLRESVELPCPFCGEVGAVTIDEGGGESQTYVEDCSVCCKPRVVHVEIEPESKRGARIWLDREA